MKREKIWYIARRVDAMRFKGDKNTKERERKKYCIDEYGKRRVQEKKFDWME